MSKFMGLGIGTVMQAGVWGAEPPDELENRIIGARATHDRCQRHIHS
jgi:hypothetical protein